MGGGIYNTNTSNPVVRNCIFWGNVADSDGDNGGPFTGESAQIHNNDIDGVNTPVVNYSCVQGGWTGAGGIDNIDTRPRFVSGWGESWTGDGTYESGTGLTTFTNTSGGWTADELVGQLLNPDTTQALQAVITSNTATQLTVRGDFAALGLTGGSYQTYDYRLGSGSPCIDAGNNSAIPADVADLDGDGDTTEPTPYDLDGNARRVDDPATDCPQPGASCGTAPIVDMGAYER